MSMFFKKKQPQVICIGSTSKDIFFPTGDGVIVETPDDLTAQKKVMFELGGKYQVDDRYEAPGGVAANVAQGLAKLGISAGVYSKVGGDEMGRWISAELAKNGVMLDTLFVEPSVSTDLSAIIVLTQNGERTIFHNRDANEKLEILPERLRGAEWFFVSALNGDWRTNLGKILESVEANGTKLALNPGQHNLREDSELVLSALGKSDVLILNKDEALELMMRSGKSTNAEELNDEAFLIHALHAAGAKTIGMTDGVRGAWASDGAKIWHCPIGHVGKVVDSTGAGDSFGAAFFAAYLAGKPLEEMIRWGIAESGSVVGFYGANGGLLDRETIESRMATLKPEKVA